MTREKRETIGLLLPQICQLIRTWGFEDEYKYISIVNNWLSNFEPEEIPVIFKLLFFLQIKRDTDTSDGLEAIAQHLLRHFGHDLSDIHFFPLSDKAASSGSQFIYLLDKKLSNITARFHDIYKDEEYCSARALVFIDDIIGSGHQANKFFVRYLHKIGIPCYYYSLYGYKDGIDFLRRKSGFKSVFTPNIFTEENKIFSEQSKLEDKDRCRQIALKYGKLLYNEHPLGYEDSQAMICFIDNCPNNTLPIIWAGYKNEMNEKMAWHPLIERRKIAVNDISKKPGAFVPKRFANPTDLATYFYECIINEHYEEAFYCFAKTFRIEKYGHEDNVQYFKDGYNNTDSLKDKPLTFTINKSKHFSRILVHYNETANVFKFKELGEIGKGTLGDIKKIYDLLTEFSIFLKDNLFAQPEVIENLPLYLFFSPNAVEDACWTCGISFDTMAKHFKAGVRSITRVKYFDCKYSEDRGWEIKRICPVFPTGEPFNW